MPRVVDYPQKAVGYLGIRSGYPAVLCALPTVSSVGNFRIFCLFTNSTQVLLVNIKFLNSLIRQFKSVKTVGYTLLPTHQLLLLFIYISRTTVGQVLIHKEMES